MADNKKYYYLKLKDNFFDSEEMKILKSMDNGYEYACILLEMYLKSLKNDGKLVFQDTIPYNPQMLSVVLGHNIAIIEKSIKIFNDLHLIELLETGEIFLLNIQSYIGKSSSEADRVRDFRKNIDDQKLIGEGVQMYDKCTPKKEIEKEIELEIEKDIIPYGDIVNYLNLKANTKYKATSNKTKELIKARWNEKFTLDDFKTVIDIKCFEWLNGDMQKFLRPETLFGTKFEGYLNQRGKIGGTTWNYKPKNKELTAEELKRLEEFGETLI